VIKFFKAKRNWVTDLIRCIFAAAFAVLCLAQIAQAQGFQISSVTIEGNLRIETATIESLTNIEVGNFLSTGEVNDAVQRVRDSKLFEFVSADVKGSDLRIVVVEFPTVNLVAFEGNDRLDEGQLKALVLTVPRRVYSVSEVRNDAKSIAAAYANQGRIAASVEPRIIRRSDNRVDVVFEIIEGGVVEIERISFVGNRAFSDSRLRRILNTKQAGLLRLLIQRDTFIQDRIDFDKQVLKDFYNSRGYVDFQTLSVNSELSKTREAFFVTFQVQEGQQFSFGKITTSSDLSSVDVEEFALVIKTVEGKAYSPGAVENTIELMERRALQLGLDFVRVEPRVTRNYENLSLDIDYVLSRGPRVFVERIDISGNSTTLDRVIRREFKVVEGDAFNPREMRATAERIRALGFFGDAELTAKEGSAPNQKVVDVLVSEKPTGSLSFGANYNSANGVGFMANFKEKNFLGRGQSLDFSLNNTTSTTTVEFGFDEPAILNRDISFNFGLRYGTTNASNAKYDTEISLLSTALRFPVNEFGALQVKAFYKSELLNNITSSSKVLLNEGDGSRVSGLGFGYSYTLDNREKGINPIGGTFLKFSQDLLSVSGSSLVETTFKIGRETSFRNEDVRVSAVFEAGSVGFLDNKNTRVTDRFFLGSNMFRGFGPGGLGPRETNGTTINDALGGNHFTVARFEARAPSGLPEEYGIELGTFMDVGSVWGLDSETVAAADAGTIKQENFSIQSVVGASLFWTTPIGPLRFNWSRPLNKSSDNIYENFDLTIATSF